MFNFKGIRLYYYIVELLLLSQTLKCIGMLQSIELPSIIAVLLTIGLSVKIIVFDKKLHDAKHWLFLLFIVILEIIIGLDRVLPQTVYNILTLSTLAFSICIQFCLDAKSIRKKLDDDAYILKNCCYLLILTVAIIVMEIVFGYIFTPPVML
jgi:hypothetical protein